MEKERTLVLVKPEGVTRHLVGRVLTRFEDAGLKIIAMKMLWIDREMAGKHYGVEIAEKHGEKVRESLLGHITEGPIIAMILEGADAIAVTRKLVGSTYPSEALPGTIRGDFGHISKMYANTNEMPVRNLIHASADKDDAEKEIALWFTKDEMHSYTTTHESITYRE